MKFYNLLLPYLIRKAARAKGFLDPVNVLAQLGRFGQPSQVMVPVELLRAGALLHARGLINSQAIQHNLDWVWPYWVNCQFDPKNVSFVPRAFSATHINLTNRNWTGVGIPDNNQIPIVDPRGLVTAFWDGWSVDVWIVDKNNSLYPSRCDKVEQKLVFDKDDFFIFTHSRQNGKDLKVKVDLLSQGEEDICRIKVLGRSDAPASIAVSIRPYNPEGISFINNIRYSKKDGVLLINNKDKVFFSRKPDKVKMSEYSKGDVAGCISDEDKEKVNCDVGMATAAALFEIKDLPEKMTANVFLGKNKKGLKRIKKRRRWRDFFNDYCKLDIPNQQYLKLYETALRTLILHSSNEVFAGPFTYKRFWFRDAVFIVHSLLCAGFVEKAYEIINTFPKHQKTSGYFSSQEGEWDSNGQVLWVLKRYVELTDKKLDEKWKKIVFKAAEWIVKKRMPEKINCSHAGLMPAGFSAEHLGPNDYYYWDDFWSIAGLKAADYLMRNFGDYTSADKFKDKADSLMQSVEKSLEIASKRIENKAMPASVYRRLDSGAIGSLAVDYPLQLWGRNDTRVKETVEYLLKNCIVNQGFFHDMSHSGINPYLTLHIAQVLLRSGDMRFYELMDIVARLSSATGQWPEAIHPHTLGGCMGDGQHVWAAAEWIMIMRNCFIREEENSLVLCSGVLPYWYMNEQEISFGWAPTAFGMVHISVKTQRANVVIGWQIKSCRKKPSIEISIPGFEKIECPFRDKGEVILKAEGVVV